MTDLTNHTITLSLGADTSVGSTLEYLGFADATGGLLTDQHTVTTSNGTGGPLDLGDTVVADGDTLTVTEIAEFSTFIVYDNGAETANSVPFAIVTLSDGTQISMFTDGGNYGNVSEVTLDSASGSGPIDTSQIAQTGVGLDENALDYIVEGTTGGDLIDASYEDDPDGDRIDNDDHSDGSNSDSVSAGAGNDTINSGAGADTISAGAGDDMVNGGAGQDVIDLGDGADTVLDSVGNDYVTGGEGMDTFDYTSLTGEDTVIGGERNDTASTNSGDKLDFHAGSDDLDIRFTGDEAGQVTGLFGSVDFAGIENVSGGKGSDTIDASASSADQILDGGEAADTLQGGSGDDIIAMGQTLDFSATDGDDDTLVLSDGFGNDLIEGFEAPTELRGGRFEGRDQVDVTNLTDANGTPVDVNDVSVSDSNGDGSGDAVLTFPNGESITLQGVSMSAVQSDAQLIAIGIPASIPTPLNYIVEGTAAGELINAGYGGDPEGDRVENNDNLAGNNDDSIQAGGGDDTIGAGTGNDTVDTGAGNDVVYAETGDDSLLGMAGDDSLYGEAGNDTIHGGDNNDSIDGGDENDSLSGDDGNDTIWGQSGHDVAEGGAGDDFVNGGLGNDMVRGGDGNDWLEGWYGNDTIEGGAGNDFIDADNDSDLVYAGSGNDTVVGGYSVSSDTIYGGSGDDSLNGQSGDDLIYGGTGNDEIFGADGDDTIFFENDFGSDTIIGQEFDETNGDVIDLSLVTESTTIDLSNANPETGTISNATDTANFVEIENIIMGGGRDTIVLADGSGADTVRGFDTTDSGDGTANDQLDVSGLTSDGGTTPVTVDDVVVTDTNGDGTGDAILIFPGGESITLIGTAPTEVDSPAELVAIGIPSTGSNFIVEGTSGDDQIDTAYVGDPDGDRVDNNDHSDGSNDDSIEAGAGNDTVLAGTGDDTIIAGSGDDAVTGGDGNDRFVYSDGDDTITDFNTGNSGSLSDGDNTNNDFVDLSGHYDQLSELYADQADDGVLNQTNTLDTQGNAVDYSDNTAFGAGSLTFNGASADGTSFTVENTGVVCFTSGTAIRTPLGDVLIDDLRVGDLVSTADNGAQRIRWIGKRHIYGAALSAYPNLRPVLIKRGVLGAERDLLVSRQHGMLAGPDHLVRAAHLVDAVRGVRVANGKREVTYIHLMFDAHQIIFAENTKSESFFPGPLALLMMEEEARDELFTLFPDIADLRLGQPVDQVYGPMARMFQERKEFLHQIKTV